MPNDQDLRETNLYLNSIFMKKRLHIEKLSRSVKCKSNETRAQMKKKIRKKKEMNYNIIHFFKYKNIRTCKIEI